MPTLTQSHSSFSTRKNYIWQCVWIHTHILLKSPWSDRTNQSPCSTIAFPLFPQQAVCFVPWFWQLFQSSRRQKGGYEEIGRLLLWFSLQLSQQTHPLRLFTPNIRNSFFAKGTSRQSKTSTQRKRTTLARPLLSIFNKKLCVFAFWQWATKSAPKVELQNPCPVIKHFSQNHERGGFPASSKLDETR